MFACGAGFIPRATCSLEQRQQLMFGRVAAAAEAAGVALQHGWATEVRRYPSGQLVCLIMPDGRFCDHPNKALQRLGLPKSHIRATAHTTASELRRAAALARKHGLQLRGVVKGVPGPALAAPGWSKLPPPPPPPPALRPAPGPAPGSAPAARQRSAAPTGTHFNASSSSMILPYSPLCL